MRPSGGFEGATGPACVQPPRRTLAYRRRVRYSAGWLFKARLSGPADQKVIYLVAAAQHESFCSSYIGRRQARGVDFGNVAGIFRPG